MTSALGWLGPTHLRRYSPIICLRYTVDCLMKKWSWRCGLTFQRTYSLFEGLGLDVRQTFSISGIHPGRLTWNLKITQLKRKIIFQTIIFKFHVNLPGCTLVSWDCCCLPGMNFVGFFQIAHGIGVATWLVLTFRKRERDGFIAFYGPFASKRDRSELDYKITTGYHFQKKNDWIWFR